MADQSEKTGKKPNSKPSAAQGKSGQSENVKRTADQKTKSTTKAKTTAKAKPATKARTTKATAKTKTTAKATRAKTSKSVSKAKSNTKTKTATKTKAAGKATKPKATRTSKATKTSEKPTAGKASKPTDTADSNKAVAQSDTGKTKKPATTEAAKAKPAKNIAELGTDTVEADKASPESNAAVSQSAEDTPKSDTGTTADAIDAAESDIDADADAADVAEPTAPTMQVALPPRPGTEPETTKSQLVDATQTGITPVAAAPAAFIPSQSDAADTKASSKGKSDAGKDDKDGITISKRTIRIALIALLILIVIGIAAGFGYHHYTTHSRSYAISRYDKAVTRLKDAHKQLDATIAKSNKTAGQVDEGDVQHPAVVTKYETVVRRSRRPIRVRVLTRHQLNTFNVTEINNYSLKIEQAAANYDTSRGKVHDSAQHVMDEKHNTEVQLSPVEHAIASVEQQKKQNDAEAKKHGIDMDAIAKGDYSSLDGTWTNSDGAWMKISKGVLTPQNPVPGSTPPYRLREPDKNNNLFNPNYLDRIPKTQHTLYQDGARVEHHGAAPDIYFLVTVQQGAKLYNASPSFAAGTSIGDDPTDSSRDRIIPANATLYQGQEPFCQSASCAYYREGGVVSTASQQKLKDKEDQANKLMASLNHKWQESAKTNFQCRIDVVNGAQKTCETASSSSNDGTANVDQLRQGDFSSIAGQWCTSGNDCITIGKDGSYTSNQSDGNDDSDSQSGTQPKLAIPTENNWVKGGVGSTGIVELMDTRGPQCMDPNVTYPNCVMAEAIWPTDIIYYPKNVTVCPNDDICSRAYEGTENDPDDIDTSRPHLELMARHMNPRPTMADTYYFMGGKNAKSSKAKKGMDIKQIAQGDCSSIAGTWVNARGGTLTFQSSCPSGSAQINDRTVQWVTPKLFDGFAEQEDTGGGNAGSYVKHIFIPAGTAVPSSDSSGHYGFTADDTDKTRDRIIGMGGPAMDDIDPAEYVYYRQ